jgi:hypothetical protein
LARFRAMQGAEDLVARVAATFAITRIRWQFARCKKRLTIKTLHLMWLLGYLTRVFSLV